MGFQEPRTALNPLHTLGRQIAEPLRLHQGLDAADISLEVWADGGTLEVFADGGTVLIGDLVSRTQLD